MNYLSKLYYTVLSIMYLVIINISTRGSIKFKSPRLGKGLSVSVYGRAKIEIENLVSRNNLNLLVSQGCLSFQKGCFVNNNCSFNCLNKIEIGENTIFGESVKVYDHDHLINDGYFVSKNEFVTCPVSIGSNCWIGSNVVILKGVSIADNVIIGANSLVNKSISSSGIYVSKNGVLTKIK